MNQFLQLPMGVSPARPSRPLFSDHCLSNLLPEHPRWEAALPKAEAMLPWLRDLYSKEQELLPEYNESRLRERWFNPIFRQLGHAYQEQPSVPGLEKQAKRPDYAFFADDTARQRAMRAAVRSQYASCALAVGEVKRWDVPLGKKGKGGRGTFKAQNPGWQIDFYVRTSGLSWGILSNGRLWRLVHQDTCQSLSIFYEIDLVSLLKQEEARLLRYFILFFGAEAFRPDSQGHAFLDDTLEASRHHAGHLEEDLKENTYRALEHLMQGFIDLPENNLSEGDLPQVYDNSLYLLYRLLLILYAESRGLLPLDNDQYREEYSMRNIQQDLIRGELPTAPTGTLLWTRLRTLFHIMNGAQPEVGQRMGVPRFNGGLFDSDLRPFLETMAIGDEKLTQALDCICRHQTESGSELVDYRALGVLHLGSTYEELLQYQPRYASEPMVATRDRKRERWKAECLLKPDPANSGKVGRHRILDRRETGQVYLETDHGERKATGSYYTPKHIVEYIVRNTLGSLVDEITERVKGRTNEARGKTAKAASAQMLVDEIMSIKVLDPAMGSGCFLVEASEYLALRLATNAHVDTGPTDDEDLAFWRRRVVERCIYGVDKNPLAVELAKLSLWLTTVSKGRPLSFLDHHLKCGDSLIGARVADLGWAPPITLTKKAQSQLNQQKAGQTNLFEYQLGQQLPTVMGRILEITETESDSFGTAQTKESAAQAVLALKAPFEAVADLWVSAYFGGEVSRADYDDALALIGKRNELLSLLSVQWARQMARKRRFFHWELAFPEVFYDHLGQPLGNRAGFDVVIGNPPWGGKLDPDEKEYLRQLDTDTRTPNSFVYFQKRAEDVLKPHGVQSFLLPDSLLAKEYPLTRKRLVQERTIREIVFIPNTGLAAPGRPFPAVNHDLVILIIRKTQPQAESFVEVQRSVRDPRCTEVEPARALPQALFDDPELDYRLNLQLDSAKNRIRQEMGRRSWRLGEKFESHEGIHSGNVRKRLFIPPGVTPVGPSIKPLVMGSSYGDIVGRYVLARSGWHVDYSPGIIDPDKGEYASLREERIFVSPKLLAVRTGDALGLVLDRDHLYVSNNLFCLLARENEAAPYTLEFLLSLLNSRLLQWYLRTFVAPRGGTLYAETKIKHLDLLPIRRIEFSTPPDERSWLNKKGQQLYEIFVHGGDVQPVLSFIDHQLRQRPEHSDVVHDLLAYLAERMSALNKEKRSYIQAFWQDIERVADPKAFQVLRRQGKQEATLWNLAEACRPFVGQDTHTTRHLDDSLGWNEEAFKGFAMVLVNRMRNLSDLAEAYRRHRPGFGQLVAHIGATDRLIDQVVYRLYDLTGEETAIVEGRSARPYP